MKIFDMIDGETGLSIGTLLYYEKANKYICELMTYVDEWNCPLLFSGLVKKGVYTISSEISLMWVRERIIPSGRQNIQSILKNHKLSTYNEIDFLEISEGRCCQDSLYIRRIKELPEYVSERMKMNICECVCLDNFRLLCFFNNEETRIVSLDKLTDVVGVSKVLGNEALYKSGKISVGGYEFVFNDTIEVPARILYERGVEVPLSLRDFVAFVDRNVYDSGKCCEVLECTRQNLSYLLGQGRLTKVKDKVNGSLFLAGVVERNRLE